MPLSISNIIWKKGKENFEGFLRTIVDNNVFSVELSLSSIFEEPLHITKNELTWLKNILSSYNVSVSSLHSLTYTRPDLEIFNYASKREELREYLLHYVYLAKELNSKNIVYGSPKSRKIYSYNKKELDTIFTDFLQSIDEQLNGINFNIEPLPKIYCEYLNTFMESIDILKDSNMNNIFIQLDIRSIIENQEKVDEIFEYNQYIKHVHIGEPDLKMPSEEYSNIHSEINEKLQNMHYTGYLSAEVLNHNQNKFEEYTKSTIQKVRYYYEK